MSNRQKAARITYINKKLISEIEKILLAHTDDSNDCNFILRNKQKSQSYPWQYCWEFLFIRTITLFVQWHAE